MRRQRVLWVIVADVTGRGLPCLHLQQWVAPPLEDDSDRRATFKGRLACELLDLLGQELELDPPRWLVRRGHLGNHLLRTVRSRLRQRDAVVWPCVGRAKTNSDILDEFGGFCSGWNGVAETTGNGRCKPMTN